MYYVHICGAQQHGSVPVGSFLCRRQHGRGGGGGVWRGRGGRAAPRQVAATAHEGLFYHYHLLSTCNSRCFLKMLLEVVNIEVTGGWAKL